MGRALRVVSAVVLLALALAIPAPKAFAQVQPSQPEVRAASAIVIDRADGNILWEKDSTQRRAIASITKLVTALAVLREAELDEVVTVSQRAQDVGDADPSVTQLHLTRGERLSVESLLYAALIPSANDAAVALAEHVGGSLEGFAAKMNEVAAEVGAQDSHFVNPTGFDAAGQHSTARDVAKMATAALQNETFAKIVATARHVLRRPGKPDLILENRNELLMDYAGADGVKTGQTRASGRSLVASATRGTERRLAVVLSSADPFAESARLLDYGFNAFTRRQVLATSKPWGQITYGSGASRAVFPSKDFSVLIRREGPPPTARLDSTTRLIVESDDNTIGSVPARIECLSNPCEPVTQTALSRVIGLISGILERVAGAFY